MNNTSPQWPQMLVLAPVHELGQQTGSVIRNCALLVAIETVCLVGGEATIRDQAQTCVLKPPQVIIGTPDCLDHLKDRTWYPNNNLRMLQNASLGLVPNNRRTDQANSFDHNRRRKIPNH
jgi:superfamily II DNA/RNA helicase